MNIYKAVCNQLGPDSWRQVWMSCLSIVWIPKPVVRKQCLGYISQFRRIWDLHDVRHAQAGFVQFILSKHQVRCYSVFSRAHHQEPATTPWSCRGVLTDRSIFSLNLSRIQIPTGTSATNCNHKHGLMLTCRYVVDMFTWGCVVILTEGCSCRLELAYFAGKYLKIDWSVKMPLHWLIIGVAGSILMAPGFSHFISGIQDTWIISRRFQFHSPVLTYPNGCYVTSQT